MAPTEDERRFLTILQPLLERSQETASKPPPLPNGVPMQDAVATMSAGDEERLLLVLLGLGQMEAVLPLLRNLAAARPASQPTQQAFATATLLLASKLTQRCSWDAANRWLTPLAASFTGNNPVCRQISKGVQIATYNLLGCCQCMLQESDRAFEYFTMAVKLLPSDPRLHQNLALACELGGRIDKSTSHWESYFGLQGQMAGLGEADPKYQESLAFESLNRLAEVFSKKESWNNALSYLQRACRLRPGEFDALERLFHMYNQMKRPDDARRTLGRLRKLRPNDPQMDLYELDLREVKTLEDIERMLTDIRKTLSKYPNDLRVEEKAVAMVANVIPLIGRMSDQYTDQLGRIMEQVRRLPNYQISWSAVHDVMRDLQREFQKLRRIANKCLAIVTSEEHKRIVRDMLEHVDKKIEVCQQMGT